MARVSARKPTPEPAPAARSDRASGSAVLAPLAEPKADKPKADKPKADKPKAAKRAAIPIHRSGDLVPRPVKPSPSPLPPAIDSARVSFAVAGALLASVFAIAPHAADLEAPAWLPMSLEIVQTVRVGSFAAMGWGVYALLGGWFVLALHLLRGMAIGAWSVRLVGWSLLALGSTVVADRIGPDLLDGPLAGNGGSIGAVVLAGLLTWFHPIGAGLIFGATMLLGAVLALDSLVDGIIRVGAKGIHSLASAGRTLRKAMRSSDIGEPGGYLVALPVVPTGPIPVHHVSEASPMPVASRVHDTDPDMDSRLIDSEAIPAGRESIPITRSTVAPAVALPKRLPTASAAYELPSLDLLDDVRSVVPERQDEQLRDMASLLESTCESFGIRIKVVGIHTGPVVTQYEIALETGLRLSRVTALSDDLALNLRVSSVRIVPLSGRNTLGVELPNEHRAIVRMRELCIAGEERIRKMKLPLILGKDSEGRPLLYDLAEMPHLLVAGRTGTGKSVCLNTMIVSLLLTRRPEECRMILIDPKKVELAEYGSLPHLMTPVVTENSKAEAILSWAVDKMEQRYELLRRAKVRNIQGYNELGLEEVLKRVRPTSKEEQETIPERLPFIVIVVDEVGDLMMEMKKEVEGHIIRLAQKSRAAGIHLILTTQKPTVDVITGLIKSNLPARICFQVTNKTDSRVVLDEGGADKLLGKGDMLFLQPNTGTLVRAQGTYASDDEITRIVRSLECEAPNFESELANLDAKPKDGDGEPADTARPKDDLYAAAVEIVIREQRGSVSLLQRALGIGYGRAGRLIDMMAEDGIVGNYKGQHAREVLMTFEEWKGK